MFILGLLAALMASSSITTIAHHYIFSTKYIEILAQSIQKLLPRIHNNCRIVDTSSLSLPSRRHATAKTIRIHGACKQVLMKDFLCFLFYIKKVMRALLRFIATHPVAVPRIMNIIKNHSKLHSRVQVSV